jgi:hypothetical protein
MSRAGQIPLTTIVIYFLGIRPPENKKLITTLTNVRLLVWKVSPHPVRVFCTLPKLPNTCIGEKVLVFAFSYLGHRRKELKERSL